MFIAEENLPESYSSCVRNCFKYKQCFKVTEVDLSQEMAQGRDETITVCDPLGS